MIFLIEILKHYIIILDYPLISQAEIAVIPDYDVIQHLELHNIHSDVFYLLSSKS